MWIDTRISTPSGKEWLVSIKEQRDKYKEWELPFHLAIQITFLDTWILQKMKFLL